MAGTLVLTTLSDGTNSTSATNAIRGSAKAWCNYNGSSQTVINSFNVSSVTRNATGDYTYNFTTAMPNANYVVMAPATSTQTDGAWRMAVVNAIGNAGPYYQAPTASTCRIIWVPNTVTAPSNDNFTAYMAVFSN